MSHPLPSAGRIVTLTIEGRDGQPIQRPAIVVDDRQAKKGRLGLKVFLIPSEDIHIKADYYKDVPFNPAEEMVFLNSWHWPDRVEGSMDLAEERQEKAEKPAKEKPDKAKKKGKAAQADGGQTANEDSPATTKEGG